jgi:hypothetical protein
MPAGDPLSQTHSIPLKQACTLLDRFTWPADGEPACGDVEGLWLARREVLLRT